MSLDGLRAWIGLVEQKLAKRTRVFLVLVAIAIGGAGAALYLAIDAQNSAVSESDLQNVRDELAGGAGAPEGGSVAGLEAQIEALQAEIAELKEEGGTTGKAPDTGPTTPEPPDGTGGTGSNGTGGSSSSGGSPSVPKTQAQLEALVEKAEKEAGASK